MSGKWRPSKKNETDDNGSMCLCGCPRKKNKGPCGCGKGYPECSKTGPDGAVCDNPYHSRDI